MERDRQEALHKERTRMEDDEQRRTLDDQKRERELKERKRQEEEELLLHELMNYDFHKCPRIKKEAFQDLEVDDIDLVRIAVIGATSSGKTSLIGKNRFLPVIRFLVCSLLQRAKCNRSIKYLPIFKVKDTSGVD